VTDFGAWCQSSAPAASGHEVVLRGLAPLVQAEILLGLQERCRYGALTYLYQLRIICRRLLDIHASTITGFDVSRLARHHRALAQDLQQAVLRAGTSPEDEQRKDIWNTAVLGHGRRRVIDFTGISQTWLREALKRWAAEELPTRRGDHATAILQDHVHRIGELSASLRLHRDDHGDDPRALGRGDIIAFLSRLQHRQATGQMSSWRRSTTCRQVAMILRECRALGLTRPGQPMSGLPDDFAVRRDDIPQQAFDHEPSRALPAGVLNQLIAALPLLEQSAGAALRAAVGLLMDTGRRPTEICTLGWDCLDQDSDGKYALIYTDFKANRAGRRLPITGETAKVIIGQQQRVRARYPGTPAAELALFPRPTRNRGGKRPIVDSVVPPATAPGSARCPHCGWKTAGVRQDRRVLHAYRHSFAQRHADAGTPVDVLKDLMGHRSMSTTQLLLLGHRQTCPGRGGHPGCLPVRPRRRPVRSQARALLESEHQRWRRPDRGPVRGVSRTLQRRLTAEPARSGSAAWAAATSAPTPLPARARDYLDTCCKPANASGPPRTSRSGPEPRPCPPTRRSPGCGSSSAGPNTILGQLGEADRRQITQAVEVVRATRRTVHLGTGHPPAPPDLPRKAAHDRPGNGISHRGPAPRQHLAGNACSAPWTRWPRRTEISVSRRRPGAGCRPVVPLPSPRPARPDPRTCHRPRKQPRIHRRQQGPCSQTRPTSASRTSGSEGRTPT
jgi:integrase